MGVGVWGQKTFGSLTDVYRQARRKSSKTLIDAHILLFMCNVLTFYYSCAMFWHFVVLNTRIFTNDERNVERGRIGNRRNSDTIDR